MAERASTKVEAAIDVYGARFYEICSAGEGAASGLKAITDKFVPGSFTAKENQIIASIILRGKRAGNYDGTGNSFTKLGLCHGVGMIGSKAQAGRPANYANTIASLFAMSTNVTDVSIVGKGGKTFKTLRVPKAIFRLPMPEAKKSGIMTLIQIINSLWYFLFPGIRPIGIFTKAMLAYFKSLAGADPGSESLSPNDIKLLLSNILPTNFPKLVALYHVKRTGRALAVTQLQTQRTAYKEKRDAISTALQAALNDPNRAMSAVADALLMSDQLTPTEEQVTQAKTYLTTVANELPGGEIRKTAPKGRYVANVTAATREGLDGNQMVAYGSLSALSQLQYAPLEATDTTVKELYARQIERLERAREIARGSKSAFDEGMAILRDAQSAVNYTPALRARAAMAVMRAVNNAANMTVLSESLRATSDTGTDLTAAAKKALKADSVRSQLQALGLTGSTLAKIASDGGIQAAQAQQLAAEEDKEAIARQAPPRGEVRGLEALASGKRKSAKLSSKVARSKAIARAQAEGASSLLGSEMTDVERYALEQAPQ
jgi:hypothetical protein